MPKQPKKKCDIGIPVQRCYYKKDINKLNERFNQIDQNYIENSKALNEIKKEINSKLDSITYTLNHIQLNGEMVTLEGGMRQLYELTKGLRDSQQLKKAFYNSKYGKFLHTKTGKFLFVILVFFIIASILSSFGLHAVDPVDSIKWIAKEFIYLFSRS